LLHAEDLKQLVNAYTLFQNLNFTYESELSKNNIVKLTKFFKHMHSVQLAK